jgi:hypothetical protein
MFNTGVIQNTRFFFGGGGGRLSLSAYKILNYLLRNFNILHRGWENQGRQMRRENFRPAHGTKTFLLNKRAFKYIQITKVKNKQKYT